MLVTMFTDAGFDEKLKVGTWACWAKLDGKTYRFSGIFKEPVNNSTTAELRAIINGLYCFTKNVNLEPNSKVIIQTDSQNSINILTKPVNAASKMFAESQIMKKLFAEYGKGLTFDFRRVESHKGTKTKRHAVNTWCDQECKMLLTKVRNQVEPQLDLPPAKSFKSFEFERI